MPWPGGLLRTTEDIKAALLQLDPTVDGKGPWADWIDHEILKEGVDLRRVSWRRRRLWKGKGSTNWEPKPPEMIKSHLVK